MAIPPAAAEVAWTDALDAAELSLAVLSVLRFAALRSRRRGIALYPAIAAAEYARRAAAWALDSAVKFRESVLTRAAVGEGGAGEDEDARAAAVRLDLVANVAERLIEICGDT
eukprot:Opistho-2@10983